MTKSNEHLRIKHIVKVLAILLFCSLILAVPTVKLTLNWSMDISYSLYGEFTRIFHLHSPPIIKLDVNGVPTVDYGYQKGKYMGIQRNPLTIATQAISYYDEFCKSGQATKKEYFLNCIRWLEEFRIDKGNYSLWAYEFDAPEYNASAPWYSAMAQARIMVAFECAYKVTQNNYYQQLAGEAMQALTVPIELGGVLYVDPKDGGKWYEELAAVDRESPPLILNGFVYSLLDLHDYYIQTGSQKAKSLFEDGIIELKRHLIDYDTGRWTYYDREGHLAYDYHYTHINQMEELYKITNDLEFKTYHEKWESYFPFNPLWARQRFAAYLFDFAIILVFLSVTVFLYKIFKDKVLKNNLRKVKNSNGAKT